MTNIKLTEGFLYIKIPNFLPHLLLILIQSAQTNTFLFTRSELTLFNLHHKLITAFHCLRKICFQSISPETTLLGVYLPTPRKKRHALFYIALMQE